MTTWEWIIHLKTWDIDHRYLCQFFFLPFFFFISAKTPKSRSGERSIWLVGCSWPQSEWERRRMKESFSSEYSGLRYKNTKLKWSSRTSAICLSVPKLEGQDDLSLIEILLLIFEVIFLLFFLDLIIFCSFKVVCLLLKFKNMDLGTDRL